MPTDEPPPSSRHVGCFIRHVGASLHADALRTATQILGSAAQLALFLGVDDEQLERWMAGAEAIPLSALVQTLDLISDGSYAVQRPPASRGRQRSDDTANRASWTLTLKRKAPR